MRDEGRKTRIKGLRIKILYFHLIPDIPLREIPG